jgi:ribosomal protein L11 methyltransferase
LIRLAIRVDREHAELVLAELLELAPNGLQEAQLEGGITEYAIYGAPGELPALPDLHAAAGQALVEVSSSELPDDWSERWKQFHKPVLIASPAPTVLPSLHVRAPWEPPSSIADTQEIVIDPGQAFGTGAHATTRLCLELLLELTARAGAGQALTDIGTGSGVLAIAAHRLGFGPVLALDHERESVEAARQNAKVNDVQIDIRRFDLRSQPLPSPNGTGGSSKQGVVLANLLRPLLLGLADTIGAPPAHLLSSGLLRSEADDVANAFAQRLGMRELERRESGEWAALWLAPGGA